MTLVLRRSIGPYSAGTRVYKAESSVDLERQHYVIGNDYDNPTVVNLSKEDVVKLRPRVRKLHSRPNRAARRAEKINKEKT